jgi:membrane protein YdbS with pleckstrin-like domain
MLNEREQQFIEYWEKNRDRRKKVTKQLSIGLPFAVVLVAMIFINVLSGWYKRAAMSLNTHVSLIPVMLVAGLSIVVFFVIFSARHRWEQDEQHYRELLARKKDS